MCLSMLLADGVSEDVSVFESARALLPRVKGAFCLTFTDGHTLYAARDPHGVRPLVLGRLPGLGRGFGDLCARHRRRAVHPRD